MFVSKVLTCSGVRVKKLWKSDIFLVTKCRLCERDFYFKFLYSYLRLIEKQLALQDEVKGMKFTYHSHDNSSYAQ